MKQFWRVQDMMTPTHGPEAGRRMTMLRESVAGDPREPGVPPPGSLRADAHRAGGQVVVRLRGELDVYSAPTLRRTLADINVRDGVKVALDVAELTFMDAAGLGALLAARRDVLARGGDMVLHAPSPAVSRVLRITGVANRFTISRRAI